MTLCEDCGEDCKRRTRCPNCKLLVCSWCWHHSHNLFSEKVGMVVVESFVEIAKKVDAELISEGKEELKYENESS